MSSTEIEARFARTAAARQRAALRDGLSAALDQARERGEGVVALIRLELDGVRAIRAAYGREVGGLAVQEAARRVRAVAGGAAHVAQPQRDGLLVLLPKVDGEVAARARAEALLAALSRPIHVHEQLLRLSVAAGLAVSLGDDGADGVLRAAELAAGSARSRGDGVVVQFDEALERRVAERARIGQELERALERDELALAFQPIVDVITGQVTCVEALVRWRHPEQGLLAPAAFLEAAHETGVIVPIGRWILDEACRHLARWAHQRRHGELRVSVNVSMRELAGHTLPGALRDSLRRTGAPPGRLVLELTETALAAETASPIASLERLRELGVGLALGGFGAGSSSMTALTRLPVQSLKIDRAFVAGIGDSEADRHILRAITAMATALELGVVAEGIETQAQARVAHALGCVQQQGYLYAAPVLDDAIDALLDRGLDVVRLAPAAPDEPALEPPAAPSAGGATVTLGEAARVLRVSDSTLRRWADAGTVASVRTEGGHRRFAISELQRVARAAGAATPTLRVAPLPTEPLPTAAAVLRDGGGLARTVGRALYEPGAPGWFATPAARPHLDRWSAQTAAALAEGDGAAALQAGQALLRDARFAGASLAERLTFAERCAELLGARLGQAGAGRDEVVALRRLLARLRDAALADVPAGV